MYEVRDRLVTKDARKIVTNLNMAEPNYTNWDRILIYSSEQIIKSQKMETKEHPIKTGYWNLVQLKPYTSNTSFKNPTNPTLHPKRLRKPQASGIQPINPMGSKIPRFLISNQDPKWPHKG